MPKKEKGKSHSKRPLSRRSPNWSKYTSEEVEGLVVKLAREGQTPSQIGVILRDQHGIPLTKTIVGKGIVPILRDNNLAPTVPEDLDILLKKATRLRAHLEKNKSDKYSKRSIQRVESKIRHLSNYYKNQGILSEEWKYKPTAIFS